MIPTIPIGMKVSSTNKITRHTQVTIRKMKIERNITTRRYQGWSWKMWAVVFRKETKIVIIENVMDTIGNQLRSMLAYATCIFSGLEWILSKNSEFL
jgi:hypothetical protein